MTDAPTTHETASPSADAHAARPHRGPMIAVTVAVVAAAIAFGLPTRHGAFTMGDDQRFITEHALVNQPSWQHAWDLLNTVHGDLYQPLPMLSFQADYALAGPADGGPGPVDTHVFHLTNITLHALNAVLACLIAWRFSRRVGVALLTGLAFACHPLALEPVAWISGRMILLATAFSLSVLLLALGRPRSGRGSWPIWTGICWLLALSSKVLPTVPLAAAWLDWRRRGRIPRRAVVVYAAMLVVTGAVVVAAVGSTRRAGFVQQMDAESTASAPVRIMLAGRHYLESYVWPGRLAPWSPPPGNVALLSWAVAVGALEFAFLIALTLFARRRHRLVATGLVLFMILMVPFLAAGAARRFLAADRYLYLPGLGLHMAAAGAVIAGFDAMRRRLSQSAAMAVIGLPCLAILTGWLATGRRHAVHWTDSVAQARRTVDIYPDRVEAHAELARALVFQDMPDEALGVIGAARSRWPNDARLATQAGEARLGMHDWQGAERELRAAVARRPNHARTRYQYAAALEALGRNAEARTNLDRILVDWPAHLPAMTALARLLELDGDLHQAADLLERVVRLNPYHRNGVLRLAKIRNRLGAFDRARELLEGLLESDPEDRPAALHLGIVLTRLNRYDEALAIYDGILAIEPSAAAARLNRAGLLATTGRDLDAARDYRAVLAADPGHLNAAAALHRLLQRQGRHVKLVELWRGFKPREADRVEAAAWLTWANVLADRVEDARSAAASIPLGNPARHFADWALAWDALRRGDTETLARLMDELPDAGPPGPGMPDRGWVLGSALADLPPEVRETPVGTYVLARVLAYRRQVSGARAAIKSVVTMPDGGPWAESARDLADRLDEIEGL